MQRSSELRLFAIAFASMAIAVFAVLRFGVIERISYAVEKGRLQAVRETLPSEDRVAELTRAARDVVQLAAPAVVSIEAEYEVMADAAGPALDSILDGLSGSEPQPAGPGAESPAINSETPSPLRQGLGSGFVFDADNGYILTNAHVIDGATRVRVRLADGRRRIADVLGVDPTSDLAVVRVSAGRLHELPLTTRGPARVGDEVLAIGNPFGLDGTVTKGIISATDRRNILISGSVYDSLIQTDAVITPGSSGGPLLNLSGEVVGIATAMATGTGRFDGVGFAIPAARARELVDDLISGGPGNLGVWVGTAADEAWRGDARQLGWTRDHGALVTEIIPGSAAEAAGLRPGDVIAAIDGQRIETMEQLAEHVAATRPGTRVEMKVWRDRAMTTIPVTIGRRYAPRAAVAQPDRAPTNQ